MSEYLIQEESLISLANSIRNKTGLTEQLSLNDMITSINDLQLGVDTSDATASSGEIAEGYTAYVNGVKLTGEGEILASAGTSIENFLIQNPGYFDNVDTTTYTAGNTINFNIEQAFRFEIKCMFKLGSSWQKYNNFEDYGVMVYKDKYGLYTDTGMTYSDFLNTPGVIVYEKKDVTIADKVYGNYPGMKVMTRNIWLDEGITPIYVCGFIKVNGQVYIRPNGAKFNGMRDIAQQLANNNATSNPAVSNLMNALITLIDTYLIKFPSTTTFNFNRNQIANYETEIG